MSFIVSHLSVSLADKLILRDISLTVNPGTVHVLMGPNGSGKSTFAAALMGDPKYILANDSASASVNGTEILSLPTDERAKTGLFLAFQNPIAVPGVNVANLLRTAVQPKIQGAAKQASVWEFNKRLVAEAQSLHIAKDFLRRGLNEEFSGGEKKKLEMLQAIVLAPKYAIFDEIDTGLDVDALKIVAGGIQRLKDQGCGVLIITHYQRILRYVQPDAVHILVGGSLVQSGAVELVEEVEKNGYQRWIE